MQCSACQRELEKQQERELELCRACAAKYGVIAMPPALRPPVPCDRCKGRKFVRVIPREHTTLEQGDSNRMVSAPMFLTQSVSGHKGWLLNHAHDLDITAGHGMLEVYACWSCGAVEWYCRGVQQIPIHPSLMTELIDYDQGGPYR